MFSERASSFAESVDYVMLFIVGTAVILLIGITIAMIYFVIRYSKKRNPVASQIHGHTVLEIMWIVIPTALVLVMFYFGYIVFEQSRVVPKGALNVKVIARMWAWKFEYENGKTSDTLYLPKDRSVKLNLVTMDVNHAFFIPAFRIKEDVMSGNHKNYLVIHPTKIGDYQILCAEYCGLNHSNMYSKLKVISQEDFNKWLAKEKQAQPIKDIQKDSLVNASSGNKKYKYLTMKKCISCHSLDGSKRMGPSFINLTTANAVVLNNGKEKTIIIDEGYLRSSITDPDKYIVKGYRASSMPEQMSKISKSELDSLVRELMDLKNSLAVNNK